MTFAELQPQLEQLSAADKRQAAAFLLRALQADAPASKPWMAFAGVFADDPEGSRSVLAAVEESCEQIDPAAWR